jgi:hypothetical protein
MRKYGRVVLRYRDPHRQRVMHHEYTLTADRWAGLAPFAPLTAATARQLPKAMPGFEGESGQNQLSGLRHYLASAKRPIKALAFDTRKPLSIPTEAQLMTPTEERQVLDRNTIATYPTPVRSAVASLFGCNAHAAAVAAHERTTPTPVSKEQHVKKFSLTLDETTGELRFYDVEGNGLFGIGQATALEARDGQVKVTGPDDKTKVFGAKLPPRSFPDIAQAVAACFGVEDEGKPAAGSLSDQIANLFETGD